MPVGEGHGAQGAGPNTLHPIPQFGDGWVPNGNPGEGGQEGSHSQREQLDARSHQGSMVAAPGYEREPEAMHDGNVSVVSNSAMSDIGASMPMQGFVNEAGSFIPTMAPVPGDMPGMGGSVGGIALPQTQTHGHWVEQDIRGKSLQFSFCRCFSSCVHRGTVAVEKWVTDGAYADGSVRCCEPA